MIYRTYFSKNNCIIKNTYTNTAKNQVIELFHGEATTVSSATGATTYSRYLFHFPITVLQQKIADKTIITGSGVTHTLKMTNTSFFDKELLGQNALGDRYFRAVSFDLVLFAIPEEWDEGVGYDYTEPSVNDTAFQTNRTFLQTPSNWIERKTGLNWANSGVVASGYTVLASQHFDNGNENINMDVTHIVNGLLSGDTNYGFGIAFSAETEQELTQEKYFVGFFSKYTNTIFEPFIETYYNDYINDDRQHFYLDKPNKLYLYSNIGGAPTNITIGSVTIYDPEDAVFATYSANDIQQTTQGVYYVNVTIPSAVYGDLVMFKDVWEDITYNSISLPDVELNFVTHETKNYYQIGSSDVVPQEVAINLYGLKRDERIKSGDIRKVYVEVKPMWEVNAHILIDTLSYRLYMRQGQEEIPIVDWTNINRSFTANYFLIDTSWLLATEYYLDVKLTSNLLVKTYPELVKFRVVGEDDKFNLLSFNRDVL